MSTQSTATTSFPASPIKPEPGVAELCTALLPYGTGHQLISRNIPELDVTISVRPLSVAEDVPILYKWMSHEYAGPLLAHPQPPHELEEYYNSMIESDFSQPFMGLVNNIPVCQMDVFKAQQDALSLYYEARPGDYGLQWMIEPMTPQEHLVLLLKTCLEYFFAFHEVGRVIVDVENGNEAQHLIFKQAGFVDSQPIQMPFKSSNLYICTRESFRQGHE